MISRSFLGRIRRNRAGVGTAPAGDSSRSSAEQIPSSSVRRRSSDSCLRTTRSWICCGRGSVGAGAPSTRNRGTRPHTDTRGASPCSGIRSWTWGSARRGSSRSWTKWTGSSVTLICSHSLGSIEGSNKSRGSIRPSASIRPSGSIRPSFVSVPDKSNPRTKLPINAS